MVPRKRHRRPENTNRFQLIRPPSNDHELQIDGFEYKFKQPVRPKMKKTEIGGKEYELGRTWARKMVHVHPYGIIAINPFTKKVHIESTLGKHGKDDWKPALQKS